MITFFKRACVYILLHMCAEIVLGALLAGVSFRLGGEYFDFGFRFGVPIGFVISLVCSPVSFLLLRNVRLAISLPVLTGFVCVFGFGGILGVSVLLYTEYAAFSAFLGAILGYIMGVYYLMSGVFRQNHLEWMCENKQ